MHAGTARHSPTFQPLLRVNDSTAEYWLRQVTLRLRREMAWLRRDGNGAEDPIQGVLDQTRFVVQRTRFFSEDPTAGYLTDLIQEAPPAARAKPKRGSFAWVVQNLALSPLEQFLLALALCPVLDSSAETVIACCQNNPGARVPTLALAQRLWDEPEALLPVATTAHSLFRYGLFAEPHSGDGIRHDTPLIMAPEVAQALVAQAPSLPPFLVPVEPHPAEPDTTARLCAGRLRAASADRAYIVPILGEDRQPLAPVAAAVAAMVRRKVVVAQGLSGGPAGDGSIGRLMTLAWLHGVDLYVRYDTPHEPGSERDVVRALLPLPSLPIVLFVGLEDRRHIKHFTQKHRLPAVLSPASTYAERLEAWQRHLPAANAPHLAATVRECARRFRYPAATIAEVCAGLTALERPPEPEDLIAACRSDLDLGDLAQPVTPRFDRQDLMLPPAQAAQFDEILRGLLALGTVHHEWGTAKIWNEGGLSALFAGPPGTGKTMAAEVIAAESKLPLFRVDLSQVVNKYIGETEKNLRRLFDAAEQSDIIIFFDEADSLFGKRTEVKDAHDRYANLEVSYLLERMERFKGLAILATNRKRDLDEAFLRRLRFVIDFPLPGETERLHIWQRSIPPGVRTEGIDFPFLAARFPLAGGHIRSIVFNACLQSARPGEEKILSMEAIVAAVKREHDKLDRGLSLEKYGPYAGIVKKLL